MRRLWLRDQVVPIRGGWRQREAQGEGRVDHGVRSRAATTHLQEWCNGDCSAAALQRHMEACVLDGLNHPTVVRLARCGSGKHAQRDLLALLEEKVGLAALQTVIDVPDQVTRQHWGEGKREEGEEQAKTEAKEDEDEY